MYLVGLECEALRKVRGNEVIQWRGYKQQWENEQVLMGRNVWRRRERTRSKL